MDNLIQMSFFGKDSHIQVKFTPEKLEAYKEVRKEMTPQQTEELNVFEILELVNKKLESKKQSI